MCLLDNFEEDMIEDSDLVEIKACKCIIELGVKRPFDHMEITELKFWLNTLNNGDSNNILSDYQDGKYSFAYFSEDPPLVDIADSCTYLLKLSVVENILWIGVKKSRMYTPYVIYPNHKVIEWYQKYGQPDKDGVIQVDLCLLFMTTNPIFGAYSSNRLLNSSLQFQESIASLFIFNPILPNNPKFETPRIWPCKELAREYENCKVTKWDNALQENKDNSGFQLWKIDKNMFACRIEQDHISEALEEKADSDKETGNHHRFFKTAFTFKVNDSQTGSHKTIFLKLRYLKGTNEIPDLEAYAFIV